MKILHINTNDKGGAATACIRIHLELLRRGVDSKILFLNRRKAQIPEAYQFRKKLPLAKRIGDKIMRALFKKSSSVMDKFPQIEWFTSPLTEYDITEHPLYRDADIIQLNWVSGFLDEPSFFKKNKKPVVWRMPDLYACGGGYHYEKGFPFDELRDLLSANTSLRTRAIKEKKITFVAISNWVKEKADKSPVIRNFPKVVIHNGLDFSVFKPIDKKEARLLFNLPLEVKIVLLGADVLNSHRKGVPLAIEALKRLESIIIQPVIFGEYQGALPAHFIRLGYVSDERLMSALYSASDLFIMSSIEEAFGQVTIEALSCGVPVVSFPNGGSLDIIKDRFNGVLASDFTTTALSEALQIALDTSFDTDSIIQDVKKRFNIHQKVDQYIVLYEKLLNH